ncbi:MAG: methyl-galactoside ABC transporter substrate-binding protein [Treponema sp. CETP13]|nr:MAG: methyl-galactoside ABC transporter substrate-binding protein [Treponema sp. CETP13]
MKKTILIFICSVFFMVELVAMGAQEDEALPVIGCTIYKYDDTFMTGIRNELVNFGQGKANLKIVDSLNNQDTQNAQVDTFIKQNVSVLAINPVDRASAGIEIDKAKAANIPIMFFNREPFVEDMAKSDKVYYVGTQASDEGKLEGEIISDYWNTHPEADKNKDGILQYVLLKGEPGHQDTKLRSKSSIQSIKDRGILVEKLAEDTGMWDWVNGQQKMSEFIASYGDRIEAVISNNDDMALGAIEVLKASGYFVDNKYMPVVGVDATAPALQAIEEGSLLGSVHNDSKSQARAIFNIAYQLAIGGDITEETIGYPITNHHYVWIFGEKVTQENYKEFM